LDNPPSPFPAAGATGIELTFTLAENPDVINALITNGLVYIPIAPAVQSTNIADNPFAGMANVRLTLVRARITGATTSDQVLRINIAAGGSETIVAPDNTQVGFTHDPSGALFKYNYVTGEIENEADFGVVDSGGGSSSTWALIGPFTTWTVHPDPLLNLDLDLTNVTQLSLEFQGTTYAFTGDENTLARPVRRRRRIQGEAQATA
jgi:hypothetical protein